MNPTGQSLFFYQSELSLAFEINSLTKVYLHPSWFTGGRMYTVKEEAVVHYSSCDFPKESADMGVTQEGGCRTLPCPMHLYTQFHHKAHNPPARCYL